MLLEDCPICKMISAGDILQKGTYCHKIKMDGNIVIVGSEHQEHAGFQGYSEACGLLFGEEKEAPPNGIIREIMEWPGHWAVELQMLNEGAGKSVVGS